MSRRQNQLLMLGTKRNNCLQKATVQSRWTTNGMATARNVGAAG